MLHRTRIALVTVVLALCQCDTPHPTDAGEDVAMSDDALDAVDARDVSIDAAQDSAIDVAVDVPRDVFSDAASSGSCNFATRGVCEDFVNTHVAPYMTSCMSMGGTWSTDACPHAGAIGGCQHNSTDGSHTVLWFYDADADVAMTQSQCTSSMGMWVAP